MGSFESHYEEEVEDPKRLYAERQRADILELEEAVLSFLKKQLNPIHTFSFEGESDSINAILELRFIISEAKLRKGLLEIEKVELDSERVVL